MRADVFKRCALYVALILALFNYRLRAEEPRFDATKLRGHIDYLAGEELHGRLAGTPDERRAAEYIAEQLAAHGIEAPPDAKRFQEFVFGGGNGQIPAQSANVLGWIEGSDPELRQEVIVLGAHYDHLGIKAGKIHPGADDNASGVALVLETAAAVAAQRERCARSILFVFFGGEEIGLLGSRWFINDPPVRISRIVAMVNVDMIGRPFMDQAALAPLKLLARIDSTKTIAVLGAGDRPLFNQIVTSACRDADISVLGTQKITALLQIGEQLAKNRSDHWPFESAGIPTVFFCSGQSDDYHRDGDTAEKIDGALVAKRAEVVFTTLMALSRAPAKDFPPIQNVQAPASEPVQSVTLERGNLKLVLKDNSNSPTDLSGIDSLFHTKDAPDFDAFDPDSKGASAGLNFEHIIAGYSSPLNRFAPRYNPYRLYSLEEGRAAILVRRRENCPWDIASSLRYEITEPNAVDFQFRCTPYDASKFYEGREHAIFFFANYMNDVLSPDIHFRGVRAVGADEKWITADAPPGHVNWDHGGTYRFLDAPPLQYDANHDFAINTWSYEYPRFSQPFYYGRAANDMVLILMFDRSYSEEDEIRFSLFKFKLPALERPAWDFQYVIHRVQANREYGFKGRLIWKKWVSEEDCLSEYEKWKN